MTFTRKDMETIMINGSLALKPQAVPVPVHTSKLSPLITNGWVKGSLGQYRSNGQIKTRNGFDLYVRRRNLGEYIDACSKKSSLGKAHNPFIYKTFEAGSSSSMGDPEPKLTPSSSAAENPLSSTYRRGNSLPALSSFSEYPSLMVARKGKPCLLIGYDSEWENHQSGRDMLSWQYALVDGVDLVEFVFLKTGEKNLHFLDALGCILDHLDRFKAFDIRTIRRYKYCREWKDNKPVEVITDDVQEARRNSRYVYRPDIGFTRELIQEMPDRCMSRAFRDWAWFHTFLDYLAVESIRICIVCHAGKVDLSAVS